eukprot:6172631-Pleurochrysis_carterae.AAC.2
MRRDGNVRTVCARARGGEEARDGGREGGRAARSESQRRRGCAAALTATTQVLVLRRPHRGFSAGGMPVACLYVHRFSKSVAYYAVADGISEASANAPARYGE